jgi:hypothetical protein
MSEVAQCEGVQVAPSDGRAHLSASQRAMAAGRRARELREGARQRQRAGVKAAAGTRGKASAQAAAEFHVGSRSVDQAKVVLSFGTAALVEAVERGAVSVAAGARLARLRPEAQAEGLRRLAAREPLPTVLAALEANPGVMRRFDDNALNRRVAEVKRLLDLRRSVFGDTGDATQALGLWEAARDFLRRWQRDGPAAEARQDALGRPIPPKAVPGYQTLVEIETTCRDLVAMQRRVERLAGRPGGRAIPLNAVLDLLRRANGALWHARCNTLCPACLGYLPSPMPSCPACGGSGWGLPLATCPSA